MNRTSIVLAALSLALAVPVAAAAQVGGAAAPVSEPSDGGGWSVSGLVDDGIARYRAGEVGAAILAWERARLLAPHDPAAPANLAHAREASGLPERDPTPWETASRVASPRIWLALGALALLAFFPAALALALVPRRRGVAASIAGGAAIAVLASTGAIWMLAEASEKAVVVAPGGTVARLSPFDAAEPVVELREGELVDTEGTHDGWRRVRSARGEHGWVPVGAAIRIDGREPDA